MRSPRYRSTPFIMTPAPCPTYATSASATTRHGTDRRLPRPLGCINIAPQAAPIAAQNHGAVCTRGRSAKTASVWSGQTTAASPKNGTQSQSPGRSGLRPCASHATGAPTTHGAKNATDRHHAVDIEPLAPGRRHSPEPERRNHEAATWARGCSVDTSPHRVRKASNPRRRVQARTTAPAFGGRGAKCLTQLT